MSQSNISSVLSPLSIEDEVITSSTSSQAQHQRLIRVHFHTSDPSSVRDFAKDEILYSHRVTSLTSPSVSKAVDDLPSTTTKCGIVYTSDASLPLECVDSWKSRCILRSTTPRAFTDADDLDLRDKIRRGEISLVASTLSNVDSVISDTLSQFKEVLVLDFSGEVVSPLFEFSDKITVFRTKDPMHPSGFLVCYAHWLAAKGLSASSIQTRLSQILTSPTTFGVGLTLESDRVRSMRIILSLGKSNHFLSYCHTRISHLSHLSLLVSNGLFLYPMSTSSSYISNELSSNHLTSYQTTPMNSNHNCRYSDENQKRRMQTNT